MRPRWSGAQPDLVIVDMALPDRDALEDIRAVSAGSPVAMFAGTRRSRFRPGGHRRRSLFLQPVRAWRWRMCGRSVFCHRPVPALPPCRDRTGRRQGTAERTPPDRTGQGASSMKNRKMTEPEAYRWLQKKAMNESRKLARVVVDFVAEHEKQRRESKPPGGKSCSRKPVPAEPDCASAFCA